MMEYHALTYFPELERHHLCAKCKVRMVRFDGDSIHHSRCPSCGKRSGTLGEDPEMSTRPRVFIRK